MNSDQLAGQWKELKGKVQAKWGKLTDDDFQVIDGKREQLVGVLQKHYGIAKEEVERQVDDFEKANKS